MKNNILLTTIKVVAIISLFTPLIVNSNFIFPFVFPKTAAFQILVEIMFFAWLLLMIKQPEFRPRRTKIFWAFAICLSVMILASIFGVDFAHSFWSNYERMAGIISLLHYFVFFLVLSSVLKTKKDWLLFFDFFIVASILLSLFAFGQKLNLKGFVLAGQGRVSATFGNPAYFAAYLLFILFFIVFMFFQRRTKGMRIYYITVFLFTFLIFAWTETRGAILGFSVSLILFLFALIFWPKEEKEGEGMIKFRKRIKKVALIIFIGFVLFASVIYFFRDAEWLNKSAVLHRLTTISFKEATTQTRLLAWRLSFKGFLERPILGWGWENYNVVFNKFYDPHLFPVENWFDRAHNIVFDVAVTTGLIGFLSYLAIFGAIFWVLWRGFRQKRIDFLNGALFAILMIGYFLQNFFVFDMLHSYLPFFTVLAFVNWIEKTENKSNLSQKNISPNLFLKIILAVCFIFVIYWVNIRPGLTGYYGIKALKEQSGGPSKLMENFKKSLSYNNFGRFESRLQLLEMTRSVINNYQNLPDKAQADELINFALAEGEKTVKERPLDSRYLLMVGQLNLIASQLNDGARLNKGAEILESAYQLSPTKQIILFAFGEAKLKQGEIEQGLNLFKKAAELNDAAQESHWNLALIYFSLGDIQNGQAKIAEIQQRFGPLDSQHLKRIADILGQLQKYQEAIPYLLKAIEFEPANADYYATLAGYYAQIGEKAKAKEAALKAAELNPDIAEAAEEFIKSLEK